MKKPSDAPFSLQDAAAAHSYLWWRVNKCRLHMEDEEGGGERGAAESAAGLSCALRINQTIWGSITQNLSLQSSNVLEHSVMWAVWLHGGDGLILWAPQKPPHPLTNGPAAWHGGIVNSLKGLIVAVQLALPCAPSDWCFPRPACAWLITRRLHLLYCLFQESIEMRVCFNSRVGRFMTNWLWKMSGWHAGDPGDFFLCARALIEFFLSYWLWWR